jgi:ABC-2 type transport system permease protein
VRNVPTLLRRELNAYFASVMGYIVLMFFLVVMGVFFSFIVFYLSTGPTQLTAMDLFFSMFWLPSLFVIPAITMRLLAEEKRLGTIEMLMTAPVTDFEVVLAKFLGAVVLYSLMWGLTGLYVLILHRFSGGQAALDLGPIASGYVGVLIIGQFLIAVGMLASSMTRSQVAAALMTFAVLVLYLIVLSYWTPHFLAGGPLDRWVRLLSASVQMEDFTRGIVDVRPLVLYLTGTVWALFVTTRIVESRKWK